jgi:hypothetical protein
MTAHAGTHASGGADPLSLTSSQISDFASAAKSASIASFATTASFPATGSSGTLYLATDTSKLYRWESTIYVEVGAIATSVSGGDITSGILPDERLSGNVATRESVGQYFNVPSTAIETFPRAEVRSNGVGIASGSMFICFFTANKTLTISQITTSCGSAGSGLTLARMGLYTFDETTATLVARTASDTTLYATANTAYTRSLATAGGYPATYTLQAGTRYGVGVLCVGTTVPTMVGRGDLAWINALTPRIAGGAGGLSDLPTSTGLAATINVIWARLS